MERAKLLKTIIIKNSHNPRLAWQFFKRTLIDSPIPTTIKELQLTLPLITPVLIDAKMFSEIDVIHNHLLLLDRETSHQVALYTVVKLLAKSGHVDKAVSQLQSLRKHFQYPPYVALYNVLIENSIKSNCPSLVTLLYEDMVLSYVKPDIYTLNLLIGGLCDSGRLDDARELFDKMFEKGCDPNEFSFGLLIRGYCKYGFGDRGLEVLDLMKEMGVAPNLVIYNTLIANCCREGKDDEADRLVERMKEDGLSPNVVTFNIRTSSLCKDNQILEASRILRDMQIDEVLGLPKPDVKTYHSLLEGFCRMGMLEDAKTLVEFMKRDGVFSGVRSYNKWLLGLVRNGKLVEAQSIMKQMVDDGVEPNIYSYNILIHGLCKKYMFGEARAIIRLMTTSGVLPDTISYSTLLQGYCRSGRTVEASTILHEMIQRGCFPNIYTCNILLGSLWREGKMAEAEKLLQKMNERCGNLEIVSCNIVIEGLCRNKKVDKAVEIVNEMWTHGSAALGNLGNSYIGLVDVNRKRCLPNLITYTILIDGLCKEDRLDEAKKMFGEMLRRNLHPDSTIYDTFIHNLCKKGKISYANQVVTNMERKGCQRTVRTYNSLILGHSNNNEIFEMRGLMNEMRETGICPDIFTYNIVFTSLCEAKKIEEAYSLWVEMLEEEIIPNICSFKLLIKAFCRAGEFRPAKDVFRVAHTVLGHNRVLHSLMFNEFLDGGEYLEAKELFGDALERRLDLSDFHYKDLISRLCENEDVESAHGILKKLSQIGYRFDPGSFMPVIDSLGNMGKKNEVNELTKKMMAMVSEGEVTNKVCRNDLRLNYSKKSKDDDANWENIRHRDDGSAIAMKSLNRVQKGWGKGNWSYSQPRKSEFLDEWDAES